MTSGADVITLLLTDIVGSTELWERRRSAMAAAIGRHNAIVAEIVAGSDGTLLQERGEGDSTFSVFRLASDAVAAAARLARAFEAEQWPEGAPLSVRISVYTGEIEERDGSYTGLTASRGARLRSLAFGGQVLLAAATAAVVADSLPPGTALVSLGPRALKDLSRAEEVFELRVSREGSAPSEPTDDAAASTAAWADLASGDRPVGREDELRELAALWVEAAGGTHVLALIGGEPGIGKTTLAAELARRVRDAGALVLYGRWDEEPLAPYQGFRQALDEYGRACPRSILRADLREHGGEVSRLFPEVADRIGAGDAPLRGGAEAERFRLFEALDGWIEAIASRRPVLLVLDDLHWADRASLLLVQHLMRSTRRTRLMLLATFRDTDLERSELPSSLPALTRFSTTRRILLRGLGDDAVTELLRRAAGRDLGPRGADLASELHRETGGNPFFLREIIRQLAEVGGLREGAADAGVRFEVPEAVRDVIAWQVARLSKECAAALAVAGAMGQEFDTMVLAAAAGVDDDRLVDLLDEADRAGLVVEAPERETRYAFSHAVVRRVLLDAQSRARLARVHRRIGEALEARGDPRTSPAELAYHFGESAATGTAGTAIRYARLAGEAALGEVAYESAVRHLLRALELLEEYEPGERTLRCELLLQLGAAHDRAGDYAARDRSVVDAASAARELGRTDLFVQAALRYGGVLPAGPRPDPQARALLEEALELLGSGDGDGDGDGDGHGDGSRVGRALLLARLAHWSHHERPYEDRRALSDESVAIARAVGDPRALAEVLIARCWALDGPADVGEQLATSDEVLELAEGLDDHEFVLQGFRIRLLALFESGDHAAAEDAARALRELAEEFRHPEYLRLATMWDVIRALLGGRFDESERLADELHTRLQQLGHPQAELLYVAQTLGWRWFQGRSSEYLALLDALSAASPETPAYAALSAWFHAEAGAGDRVVEILRDVSAGSVATFEPDYLWWGAVVGFAAAAAAVEDGEWAAALYDLALPFAHRHCTLGVASFMGATAHYLGILARVLGRADDAVRHLEDALDRHERMGARPWAALTRAELARVLESRGDPGDRDRARELRADSLAVADELGLEAVRSRLPA